MCASVGRAGVRDNEKKGNMTELYTNLEARKFGKLIKETRKNKVKSKG